MVNATVYTIELWMHLRGLLKLSTQEARVALGYLWEAKPFKSGMKSRLMIEIIDWGSRTTIAMVENHDW